MLPLLSRKGGSTPKDAILCEITFGILCIGLGLCRRGRHVTVIKREKRPTNNRTIDHGSGKRAPCQLSNAGCRCSVRVAPTDNNDVASILPPGFVMLLVPRSLARDPGSGILARGSLSLTASGSPRQDPLARSRGTSKIPCLRQNGSNVPIHWC